MDRFIKKIIWLILLIPAVYLAIVWKQLPERIATHFNLHGIPDKYGTKNQFLINMIILIAAAAIIYLIISNIYRIDPKKYAADNKIRLLRMAFAISIFMSAICCLLIYNADNSDFRFNVKFIFGGIGLLWSILGNYMHNLKPNYFAGIRLPWTLENEENWKKTHLLAGKLWFAGGLILVIISLLTTAYFATFFFIAVTVTITLIPCIYSYLFYRKQKKITTSK